MAVVRIQDLSTAPAPLDGTEVVEIEQGGVSYKTTTQDIADLGGGGGGGSSTVVVVTGTTYTVASSDDGNFLRFTNASAKSATFDPDSTTPLPANGEWIFSNDAATGNLTLTPGSGVTLTAPAGGSLVIPPRAVAAAKRVATDVFVIFGSTNP